MALYIYKVYKASEKKERNRVWSKIAITKALVIVLKNKDTLTKIHNTSASLYIEDQHQTPSMIIYIRGSLFNVSTTM